MDGANFFQILWSIFLPLSKAGLATVALFIMVGNWNEWFTGILYMSDTKNYPLASFLQVIVVQGNQQDLALDPTTAACHVRAYHQGCPGIYRRSADPVGISVPPEALCKRDRHGSG